MVHGGGSSSESEAWVRDNDDGSTVVVAAAAAVDSSLSSSSSEVVAAVLVGLEGKLRGDMVMLLKREIGMAFCRSSCFCCFCGCFCGCGCSMRGGRASSFAGSIHQRVTVVSNQASAP